MEPFLESSQALMNFQSPILLSVIYKTFSFLANNTVYQSKQQLEKANMLACRARCYLLNSYSNPLEPEREKLASSCNR